MPIRLLALLVVVNELLHQGRQDRVSVPTASAYNLGHLFGDIARPSFCCVEGDDANGVAVLALQQMPE